MAYKKKRGILSCVVVGYTPYWIDVVNSKSGIEACVFLKLKMSDKMKASLDRAIEFAKRTHILVEKMPEEQFYKFMGFSGGGHIGQQKRMEKRIAYEALEREASVDRNPARSKSNKQGLVLGRAGLPTWERTGNIVTNALRNRIDNSKELAEERVKLAEQKRKKENKKQLDKLRKKYFYDRELQPNLTDAEWDTYLLDTYLNQAEPPIKSDSEFEAKLRESGLL